MAGIINKVFVGILPFATRTVILYTLGEQYLGLNGLFGSIITVLNLADMGINEAIVYSLYDPVEKGDNERIARFMRFYRKIYSLIGAVIFFAGIILMPLLPNLISGTFPENINIYLTYSIFLLNTVCSYWFFAYKRVLLIAYQSNCVISFVNTIIIIAQNFLQILFVLLTKDYYWYILPLPLLTIANNLTTAAIVDKKLPNFQSEGVLEKEEKGKLYHLLGGLMIGRLSDTMRNAADNIILSAFFGLVITARYGNYYIIFTALYGVFLIGGQAMQAGIGNSLATEHVEKNYGDFKKLTFLFSTTSMVAGACMIACYQPFIMLWAGQDAALSDRDMILFCVYFYILTNAILINLYGNGLGLWEKSKVFYIMEAVGNIILNIVLGYRLGVSGILLATILTAFFLNLIGRNSVIFRYYFKEIGFRNYLYFSAKYTFVTGGIYAAVYTICSKVYFNRLWWTVIAHLILALVISICGAVLIYRKTPEYLWAKNTIYRWIDKR